MCLGILGRFASYGALGPGETESPWPPFLKFKTRHWSFVDCPRSDAVASGPYKRLRYFLTYLLTYPAEIEISTQETVE